MPVPPRRMLLMVEGRFDILQAKTAVQLLRYCPKEVVAILDSHNAGRDASAIVGVGAGVPIVADIAAAKSFHPNQLIIATVSPGGEIPDAWRQTLLQALAAGMDIVNGMHQPLATDPEFSRRAAEHHRTIHDLRHANRTYPIAAVHARNTHATRILTVGTDCNAGKMLAAMELTADLRRRSHPSEFVATGQTGVMVTGSGDVLDAVKSDFVAGATETLVLEADAAKPRFILVEGQGALFHPGFSAVTLGILHGAAPDALILCHDPQRQKMRHTETPIPPIETAIHLYEQIAAPIHPCRVVGIAVNCYTMSDQQTAAIISELHQRTGLPVTDCMRTGVQPLTDAVLEFRP